MEALNADTEDPPTGARRLLGTLVAPSAPKQTTLGAARDRAAGLVLPKGVVFLPNFLAPEVCNELVHFVDKLHSAHPLRLNKVRAPPTSALDHGYLKCYMSFWGMEWRYLATSSGYFLNEKVPQVPDRILELAKEAVRKALEKMPDAFPIPPWDGRFTCLVNYYPPKWGTLNEHADDDEPSLKEGEAFYFPVISFSLGDSADFVLHPKDEEKVTVTLCSGDAILFGGKSRLLRHSIPAAPKTPRYTKIGLIPGRLNITLRAL
jgi:alkylated DNA repair dioxygenase AlkB